ncbi:CocE/NonD family hydrolase [Marinobacter salicampi]|uniref:CocE/NonD family hydrolase n=1 Tax=Marinobacter salicampi TaxID=435907 RepID=UPI001407A1FD|nr:CocE/NonD family hydrolase [Marinobacter salicampi]
MRTVDSFPYQVTIIENLFIPMRDGARLAARIWMPEGTETRPLPGILEYIPYRKRDLTRGRDATNHAYMAGHGYVCVRVDMRGSGDSDGIITDEYTRQEHEDALDVIAWMAEQDWCDGKVGMMGISWGGFNSLQLAALNPPALKAIISACSSDDLYADNMHYMGGCLLGDNLSEATVMFAFNSLPPDPKIVGDRWRDMWMERLEGSGLWLEPWLKHQRRSDYWRGSSVCEDYSAVRCPVMAVGGWADGFTNTVFRLLKNLDVPRQGLIGPWGHKYPHHGSPGPAIGFLQEVLRWWDYWLKDQDNGIMDEPMLRAWMQDSAPPNTKHQTRPGRWVAEYEWPSGRVTEERFPLDTLDRIGDPGTNAKNETWLDVQSPLTLGMAAGKWCSYGATPDLPGDQREEDGGALTFDTEPLANPIEVLGVSWLDLEVSANRDRGMVAVRVSDVAPDGKATRVTYGLLNLTHRDSDADPEPLEPGKPYRARVYLNGIAQRFAAGHRIRVSISSSYWPLAWTPPQETMISIKTGVSALHLPVRKTDVEEREITFEEPEQAPELEVKLLEPSHHNWRLIKDLAENTCTLEVLNDQGKFRINETGTEVTRLTEERYTLEEDDVTSARGETFTRRCFNREDWNIEVITRTVLTSDQHNFRVHAYLDGYEDDVRFYSQNWAYTIPRDLV